MNMNEATGHIVDMLLEKKEVTAQEISYKHKIALVQIYALMKKFEAAGAVKKEEKDNAKLFILKDAKKLGAVAAEEPTATGKESKSVKKKEEKGSSKAVPEVVNKSGRDTTKYTFQKQTLPKGQCVLAVVRTHMDAKKLTLVNLKECFPDNIVGRFGVVNTLSKAKELSPDRPRYFMKDTDIIKTADHKQVVVCSQWTSERFDKFLEVSKKLGYKITKS